MLMKIEDHFTKTTFLMKISIEYYLHFKYAGLLHNFTQRAIETVRHLDPMNELEYLRVASKQNELLVAPEGHFTLVVMQAPNLLAPPEKEKVDEKEYNAY